MVICYPENMLPDWDIKAPNLLECPFAYCIHPLDKDSTSKYRKDHVHFQIHSEKQLTNNMVRRLFSRLALPGHLCTAPINEESFIINVRGAYEYLIHNTEGCILEGKQKYPVDNRILRNGFDIGLYEQISEKQTIDIIYNIKCFILENCITNYRIFEIRIKSDPFFDEIDFYTLQKILKSNFSYFSTLIKGNYLNVCDKSKGENHTDN